MNKEYFVSQLAKLIKEHGADHKFPAHLLANYLWASYAILENTVRNTEAFAVKEKEATKQE